MTVCVLFLRKMPTQRILRGPGFACCYRAYLSIFETAPLALGPSNLETPLQPEAMLLYGASSEMQFLVDTIFNETRHHAQVANQRRRRPLYGVVQGDL